MSTLPRSHLSFLQPLSTGIDFNFFRPGKEHNTSTQRMKKYLFYRNISMVIISGSMHNLRVYERLGPFRDDAVNAGFRFGLEKCTI